jgi:hypothetical protein
LKFRAFLYLNGFEADTSMSDRIKQGVIGGLRHAATALTVPHREQKQGSQLATLAAGTDARKMGYGALAFWIVVAVLVAARVAFLDPSRIQPTSSLFGTKATSAWTMAESPSPKN